MAKLKLKADPTFQRKVGITTHDGNVVEVEFTFKHRTKSEALKLEEEVKGKDDAEVIMLVASGWELEDAFTLDNLRVFTGDYMASAVEVFYEYTRALNGARLKN